MKKRTVFAVLAMTFIAVAVFAFLPHKALAEYQAQCPFSPQEGRIIVSFLQLPCSGDKIVSSDGYDKAICGPQSASIPQGAYSVSLASYDGYDNRVNVSQPHEQWEAVFYSNGVSIATSSAISDLPDYVAEASVSGVVDSLFTLNQDVDAVAAFHAYWPDNSSANSVQPVCMALDEIILPQCSDDEDNDNDGLVDYPNDPGCDSPNDDDENQPPVITLLGDNPMELTLGDVFTDPGAIASDPEDGDITSDIVIGGDTVDTSATGTYIITYDVVDSEGLAAAQKTRTVNVNPPAYQCSDSIDNDGDGLIDYPDDPGCDSLEDDDENQPPVITVIGDNPVKITVGEPYQDQGATAQDPEDGDITSDIVVGGDTVDNSTPGTYVITYDVTDSQGLAADQKTRTVKVKSSGGGGGGGCTTNCGGGGGGNTPIHLEIFNEKAEYTATGTVLVTWDTNLQATSSVLYDTAPHATSSPDYASSTKQTSVFRTSHSMTITGLTASTTYYFRPVAGRSDEEARGIELSVFIPPLTTEKPYEPQECYYLKEYIKYGADNNPEEVRKLQRFLRDYEGFSDIEVTGFYDKKSFDAVSRFQEKYRDDVLDPWALEGPTGFVYITTKKKINEIYCQKEFPLNEEQKGEIAEFRALIERLRAQREAGSVPAGEKIKEIQKEVGQAEEGGEKALVSATTSTATPVVVSKGTSTKPLFGGFGGRIKRFLTASAAFFGGQENFGTIIFALIVLLLLSWIAQLYFLFKTYRKFGYPGFVAKLQNLFLVRIIGLKQRDAKQQKLILSNK